MSSTSSPLPNSQPLWRTLLDDRLVQVNLFALLAYAGLVVAGVDLPSRIRNAAAVFFVALTFLALRFKLSQIRAPEDRAFWNDLSRATVCWLAAPVLYLVYPQAPLWTSWTADVLYALFYGGLYLALSVRPHHRHRWRPVALERSLTWATVTVAVTGLFLYFLVPVFVDPASYDSRRSATGLFLILDAYFSGRLLHLSRTVRSPRWRLVYSFLAATTLAVLGNDLLGSLHRSSLVADWPWERFFDVSWKLPAVFLLLGARTRHHPFPMETPATYAGYQGDDSFPGPLGQTMIFALLFPLVHFTGYQAEWMNAASKAPRSWVVLVWLLLLGMVAFYQHRRLARTTADLRTERGRTERALRRIEDDLRLRKQLQGVEAKRAAANEIFAQAFQASPDVMAITRLDDGRLIDINASSGEIFGFAPQELVGRSLKELEIWARPRDRTTLESWFSENPSVREIESLFRRKSGKLGVGLFSAERIDLSGVPHVFSVVHDVTGNRHRDKGLERRAMLLDSARSAVCALDAAGRIHYWNEAAERLFGLEAGDALGRDASDLPGCGEWLAAAKDDDGAATAAATLPNGHRILSRTFPVAEARGEWRLIVAVRAPASAPATESGS